MTLGERFQKVHARNHEAQEQDLTRVGYERGLLYGVVVLNMIANELEEEIDSYVQENNHLLAGRTRNLVDRLRAEANYDVQKVHLPETTMGF